MELTRKQEEGLRIAIQRYRNHEPYTCIAGFAGTGKSTLVQFIVAALNLYPEQIAYIAYTGKAAMVLRNKGCPNATTAHKLLYKFRLLNNGTFLQISKKTLDNYKLIIVDEISMLPNELWKLLLKYKIHIIALGDPFQLPPIGDDNKVLSSPHIFLDEIIRQAKDSEIINLTMKIRNGETLPFYKGEEVQVLPASKLVDGMYLWADQILCGKNVTRYKINSEIRKLKFNAENNDPIDNDKVICLRNDWRTATPQGNVLVNGEMGTLHNVKIKAFPFVDKVVCANFELEDQSDNFTQLKMDYKIFNKGESTINKDNFSKIPQIFHPHQFDYGYCITVHKAQGDEFDKVLVIEEFLKGSEHGRWLYTACTRAAKKLVVIKRG